MGQSAHFYSAESIHDGRIDLGNVSWRYHAGDDTAWENPHLNDSDWKPILTNLASDSMSISWQGIGWFRLHIHPDWTLTRLPIAVSILQNGASEIFLNGKKVGGLGVVSADSKQEKPVVNYEPIPNNNPLLLDLNPGEDNVLAVRYSNHRLAKLNKFDLNGGFYVRLVDMNNAIRDQKNFYRDYYSYMVLLIGIALTIFLLHLLIFIFYPEKKTNLYYSVIIGLLALLAISQLIADSTQKPVPYIYFIWIQLPLFVLIPLGVLLFSYSLNDRKPPFHFFVYVIIGVVLIILSWFYMIHVRLYCSIYLLILFTEASYSIIINIVKKKQRSYILTLGFLITTVLVFVQILSNIGWIEPVAGTERGLMGFYGIFGVVFAMSIYLAKDVRDTNRSLRRQLTEVKRLSEVTLEQSKRESKLKLESEREQAKSREALLRAKTAELQLKVQQAEHERRARELDEARKLQLSMLPEKLPETDVIEMAVYMQTATEVGGDYYDYREHADGSLTIVVGDATGHGLKAGTLVTTVKSLLTRQEEEIPIPEQFQIITNVIRKMNLGILFMGLTMVRLEKAASESNESVRLTMSAAGMPPVLLYKSRENSVEVLTIKGMPLGATANFPYKEHTQILHSGDILFLLTDGIVELFNGNREMYGLDRVKDAFQQMINLKPQEIIVRLKSEISTWLEGNQAEDDITFVLLKVR